MTAECYNSVSCTGHCELSLWNLSTMKIAHLFMSSIFYLVTMRLHSHLTPAKYFLRFFPCQKAFAGSYFVKIYFIGSYCCVSHLLDKISEERIHFPKVLLISFSIPYLSTLKITFVLYLLKISTTGL